MEHSEHIVVPAGEHADSDPAHSHEAIARHVRMYIGVGIFLLAMTLITVGLSYVDFGSMNANIGIAIAVATLKAGAVAAVFMHLLHEKRLIYRILIFTAIFVIGLFLLTAIDHFDLIPGARK